MNPIDFLVAGLEDANLWEGEEVLNRMQWLVQPGQRDTRIFWVVSGSLRVYFENEEGEQTIRLAYAGNLIAALDAYITGEPTQYYIQALKQVQVRYLSKQAFTDWLAAEEAYLRAWQQTTELLIYQMMEREQDLLAPTPEERYRRVLARSPRLFQEVPHKYIASYLRMAPETLSRLKKS